MSVTFSSEELLDIGRNIWEQRSYRWFTDFEIFLMLSIPKTLGIPISGSLDRKPESGDAFLFITQRDIKDNFYDWKRKAGKKRKSQDKAEGESKSCLQESHDHLYINQEEKIQMVYIKTKDNEFFKRRIYKMINRRSFYYQLSHYRDDQFDTVAPNKGKATDLRVGCLLFMYLLRPDYFVQDIAAPIPLDVPFSLLSNHVPLVEESTNESILSDDNEDVPSDEREMSTSNNNGKGRLHSMLSHSLSATNQQPTKKRAVEYTGENPFKMDYTNHLHQAGIAYSPASSTNKLENFSSDVDDTLEDPSYILSPISYENENAINSVFSIDDTFGHDFRNRSKGKSQPTIYSNQQLQNLSYAEIKQAQQELEEHIFTIYVQCEIDENHLNPEIFTVPDEHGYNLFHRCCQQDYFYPMIQQLFILLPRLLLIRTSNEVNDPPLFVAVAAGQARIVDYLLEQLHVNHLQNEILTVNNSGENVLDIAIKNGHHQLFRELHQRYPNLPCQAALPILSNDENHQGLLSTFHNLESVVEKIAFVYTHPDLFHSEEYTRYQNILQNLNPQEIQEFQEECRLNASKKQYMIRKKYCHLRHLYHLLMNKEGKSEKKVVRSKIVAIERLPFQFVDDEVIALFSQYGRVVYSFFPRSTSTNMSEGFGEVEYDSEEAASLACHSLNNAVINGAQMKVTLRDEVDRLSSGVSRVSIINRRDLQVNNEQNIALSHMDSNTESHRK